MAKNEVSRVSALAKPRRLPQVSEKARQLFKLDRPQFKLDKLEDEDSRMPKIRGLSEEEYQRIVAANRPGGSLASYLVSKLPTPAARDTVRAVTHGLGQTGVTLLKFLDAPSRLFGNRSRLRDIYEAAERGMAYDAFESQSGVPQIAATGVHLASAGVLGRALPAVFGTNVGTDTYEIAKASGASEGEALVKGVGHGVVDTAIWTLGQGLTSKYLPKAWQWLGREIIGAGRGAASSVTSDAMLNSLGADISGEEMAKRAVHAAWMVPLLGMLKMGKGSRERALAELKKVRPDLAGERVDKVIETLENEFSDPRSQKVALAWVARKGANLPDDLAQIHQAIEVANKVKGVDFTQKSPFEIISDPAYARYLPKPKPQDVKAFSNMKRYPMGVIGFDVSDDAAGRQATREMINAYMSPSANPWCLATGKGAAKLGELGPDSERYWKIHSAVPKQIFFQDMEGDGNLDLIAFRATARRGEGRQEYYDTSDAGYSGIPIKVKVPGDPMGRYRKMVFRPASAPKIVRGPATYEELDPQRLVSVDGENGTTQMSVGDVLRQYERAQTDINEARGYVMQDELARMTDQRNRLEDALDRAMGEETREIALRTNDPVAGEGASESGEVQGTFEDVAPGKVFKGDPFRDGRSQTWVLTPESSKFITAAQRQLDEYVRLQREDPDDPVWKSSADDMRQTLDDLLRSSQYVLTEDKVRTTENGITKFRTTKYADPTDRDYEPPKPGEASKPVEIEESELVSPEWMRSRGYDPESESDVRRMQQDLNIQAWGNGREAAMAVVPTKRTYMQTKSGTPETVAYGPDGRDIVSVDFVKDGVPYREEYDYAGLNWGIESPYDLYPGDSFYQLPRPEYGVSLITEAVNRRLIRNPGTEMAEVLDDVRVDEGLEGFVRTSGNRRWRIGNDSALDSEGEMLWDLYQIAQRAQANDYLASGQERLNNRLRLIKTREAWESWAKEHGVSGDDPTHRLLVEDRQPDGTWALVGTRNIQTSPSRANTLPPPPDEIPLWTQPGLDVDGDVPFALKAGRTRGNVRAAEGGGDNFGTFRNFLATDKVPDSIFGIPVVQDESQYTDKDLEFFRRNPKAAGFYDLGDEEADEDVPAADLKGGVASAWNALRKRVGETGEVLDYGIAWMERQAKQIADRDVPVLSKVTDAVVQPTLVGVRAAVANATSGGGKYYRPEVRDERYFSKAALRELGQSVEGMHGRAAGRADGMDNAAQFNLTQTLGGFTVKDGAVIDKFDINKKYHGVPDWMTKTARVVFGAEEDPDAGKVQTRVPLTALRQDAKGGEAIEVPTLSDDRPMHIFRNDAGKVTGYGTTRSLVYEQDGRYYVIPTILPDGRDGSRAVDDAEAVRHFRETGEHWGGYADRWSAEDAAEAVHERHQRLYGKKWNDYIQDHWNEMSDEIKSDPGVADARHARIRGGYPGSLNNPGNIEKRKERRQGEVDSPHERWAKFATPQDGLREMADAIRQIAIVKLSEKGQDFTIRNFAEVYAPRVNKKGEKENDTDKYIRDLSADTGFDADEELARWDEGDMARFLRSVVKFESGAKHSAWFTDDEYRTAAAKLQEGAFE